MKARNRRITAAVFAAATMLTISVLVVPMANGATQNSLRFVTQPADAERNATITSSDFVAGNNFVQVELVDADGVRVTNSNIDITFTLATGMLDVDVSAASGVLSVTPQPLINGVATFSTGLSIATLNEPRYTSYALIPKNARGQRLPGATSVGFDIWQDGDTCTGVPVTDTCDVSLRSGNDAYSVGGQSILGASQLPTSVLPTFACAGQDLIFDNTLFVHETVDLDSPTPDPVFLTNHITKPEWKASANNGQAHSEWCFGLESAQPWLNNGAAFELQDTNGAAPGGLLYVGSAPRCPVADPQNFAPCIVSQTGDGQGGSIAYGWVTGGDPPRRT